MVFYYLDYKIFVFIFMYIYIYIYYNNPKQGKGCSVLDLNGTLDENGLTDEEDSTLELPPPSIWLYYTDDITIA